MKLLLIALLFMLGALIGGVVSLYFINLYETKYRK